MKRPTIKKRMTLKTFEGTKMDRKMDMAGAKKAGVSMKKFEGSGADKRMDRKAVTKLNKLGRNMAKKV